MNSCRSSRFSSSPTVVQSPASQASNEASSPITPVIRVDMDRIPFSRTFPGMVKPPVVSLRESSCARKARVSSLCRSDSFHIEHIPNVKDIDPDWEHDEIDEIMVISPKPRARNSFLDLGESKQLGIDDFEVLRVVGKEPSIQTILARSSSNLGLYAIKTLGKRATSAPNLLKHVRSEQTCLRIVTEGGCPFLPKLHRSFHDETRLYMVLDVYTGGSIALHLDRGGPFPFDKARFYASEIVEALSFLHSLNIVHRDVRPENVLVGADGHIVLTNFSCAKVLDRGEGTASECGTREFEAPERILGWAYDFSVDVWSFGILLCIIHFGQHPFLEGDEHNPLLIMQKRILRGQAPIHSSRIVPLTEWGLIKKCLERNAQLRPNMKQVKTHKYFSEVNWEQVKNKNYPAPYIPYSDEVDLLVVDEEIFHFYDRSDLLALDDGPASDPSDFDGFTFTWDPTATLKANKRSILKSPSISFAGDSKFADAVKPDDFLDLSGSTSKIRPSGHSARPRKLQKKRLSGTSTRSSILSTRKSVVTMLTGTGTGKIATRNSSYYSKYSSGCEGSASSGTLNLPDGIVQTGQGIGFTYDPQASRSRLSLTSTKTRSCFKSISMLFNRHKNSLEDLPRSRDEVMQQIYGSTWSLHTNEAQLSTVSFGIPDGLGRRVDSLDLQAKQPT